MTLQARLVVAGADAAIDFYQRAFGATVHNRYTDPAGRVVHAELRFGGVSIALKDEDGVDEAPGSLGGSPVILMLDVDDADAVGSALERAGARVIFAISDQSYGYRQGRFADPFGHVWMVSQDVEELSAEETQARLDDATRT